MYHFNQVLGKDRTYQRLEEALKKHQSPQLLVGLSAVHKAYMIYSLTENLGQQAHVVMPDEPSGIRLCNDINTFLGYEGAVFYPTREFLFRQMEGISREYEQTRLGVLGKILEGTAPIVVSTGIGASLYTLPPEIYKGHTLTLQRGESYVLEELVSFLVAAGYERGAQVEGVSQFAVRGGILDVFSPGQETPYRIEFWGEEIDSIAPFHLETQRREDPMESIPITPVREALITNQKLLAKELGHLAGMQKGAQGKKIQEQVERDLIRLEDLGGLVDADKYLPLLYPNPASLYDYCQGRLLFISDPANCKESLTSFQRQFEEDRSMMLEEGVLFSGTARYYEDYSDFITRVTTENTLLLDTFTRSVQDLPLAGMETMQAIQLSPWGGDYDLLKEDLEEYLSLGFCVVLYAGTEKAVKTLSADLIELKLPVVEKTELSKNPRGKIIVLPGGLSAGMKFPELGLVVITHMKAPASQKRKKRYEKGKAVRQLSDLQIGDHVVHVSHGIGVFQGIVKRQIQGVTKDYINIRYAGTDALFVPVTQLDLVSKYIGAPEGSRVRLNRLNSLEWQKTRARVKGAVKEMAKELTALYAKRLATPGYAFSPDTDWQRNFEEHFPYEETGDQLQCIQEIKEDMERPVPMDRLLCGDVGFGKTEVALRAIFKCVMDSKQCAVLVPTTILAWQHYQTFVTRLSGFPIRVELLSRFRTAKQQKEIIKKLKTGEIDVVVGTHRVVQKDVEFKDLGLCVIDEEQRFGVAHKERFKELRANIDVLTLSATPIPRTLNMVMSGIRDMSLIEEPPQDRYPVQTYVLEHDNSVILQAIQKELRRGGQVFYLHNNINSINRTALNLQKQLPDATIVAAHGRMGEETLSDIWQQLVEGEIDILVCTTIIETGVDVPNANTLIIEHAENFGLSQLYQIRGRVGRSTRRAYAYLTFPKEKALSEIATRRLSAIREFTTFGSGFQIAMRDLEIRGAGNILGAQQHGHMESVGYDMYVKLLEEAVKEETGQEPERRVETSIDIQLDAYIPESYISNTNQRIDTYKRISSIHSTEDSMDVTDELIDRFGEPPKAVLGLIDVALVRGSAGKMGIADIIQRGDKILFYPEELHMEFTSYLVGKLGRRVLINAGEKPYYAVAMERGATPLETIHETLEIMEGYTFN